MKLQHHRHPQPSSCNIRQRQLNRRHSSSISTRDVQRPQFSSCSCLQSLLPISGCCVCGHHIRNSSAALGYFLLSSCYCPFRPRSRGHYNCPTTHHDDDDDANQALQQAFRIMWPFAKTVAKSSKYRSNPAHKNHPSLPLAMHLRLALCSYCIRYASVCLAVPVGVWRLALSSSTRCQRQQLYRPGGRNG